MYVMSNYMSLCVTGELPFPIIMVCAHVLVEHTTCIRILSPRNATQETTKPSAKFSNRMRTDIDPAAHLNLIWIDKT